MSALLTLTGVSKTFENGTRALERVNLSVSSGEFVSLVGPSGCGKSTVLRLIAGLLLPDEGSVVFPGGRPEIGFVFQEPTLMPWARALDNARLPLDLAGMDRTSADNARRARWRVSDLPDSNERFCGSFRGVCGCACRWREQSQPSRNCC